MFEAIFATVATVASILVNLKSEKIEINL